VSKEILNARLFEFGRDYPEVCEWWRARNHRYVEQDLLSKVGIMIEGETNKYCVGWLYMGDSAFAKFTWVVTNPNSPLMRRKEAIALLARKALGTAKALGARSVIASFSNKNLSKIFQDNGFSHVEQGVTNILARI